MQKTETPAQKIKRLEKQLSHEKAKNLILNTLVDTIEKQYGANLRKKQHTASSGNSKKPSN